MSEIFKGYVSEEKLEKTHLKQRERTFVTDFLENPCTIPQSKMVKYIHTMHRILSTLTQQQRSQYEETADGRDTEGLWPVKIFSEILFKNVEDVSNDREGHLALTPLVRVAALVQAETELSTDGAKRYVGKKRELTTVIFDKCCNPENKRQTDNTPDKVYDTDIKNLDVHDDYGGVVKDNEIIPLEYQLKAFDKGFWFYIRAFFKLAFDPDHLKYLKLEELVLKGKGIKEITDEAKRLKDTYGGIEGFTQGSLIVQEFKRSMNSGGPSGK